MNFKRVFCWSCVPLFLVTLCLAEPAASTASEPLNVVVFVVDDLGYTDLGCYDSSFYRTPNVDRLAETGVRFTDAYAACTVCSPTRAALMTGKYPQRVGVTDFISPQGSNQPEQWNRNTQLLPAPYQDHLALDEVTVAEAFHEAGYTTYFAGKWHLGHEDYWPREQGFDINLGGCEWGHPDGTAGKQYFSPYGNPTLKDGPDGEYLTDRLGEETAEFIRDNQDRPFLAWLSFYSVHTPLMAPDDRVEAYRKRQLPRDQEQWGRERSRKVRETQNHPRYAAMVESMDRAVGRVLAELNDLGLSDRTVVVFTSDNGGLSTSEGHPTSNLPLRGGKGWAYEGGTRVPLIVRQPEGPSGTVNKTPALSNDVYPTLLDAVGLPARPEQHLDGVSLVPALAGEETKERPLYWHYPHYGNQGGAPYGAVRRGPWKLIEWYEDGSLELYDLSKDVAEENNLAKSRPELTQQLHEELRKWRNEVDAKMPQSNPKYSK